MTRNGIRGFAFGLIITTLVFWLYNIYEKKNEPFNNVEITNEETSVNNNEGANIKKTKEISLTELQEYFQEHNLVLISREEYNNFLKTQTPEKKDKEESNEEKIQDTMNTPVFRLIIRPGMSGVEIAEILQEAQIIKDKMEFVKYLSMNNYGYRLRVGTYELNHNMSFEEVAKIITKQ